MKNAKHTSIVTGALLLLVLSIFAVAAKIKPPSDSMSETLYKQMMASSVTRLQDISDMYALEWVNYLPMSLPHKDSFLRTVDLPVPLILPQQKKQWDTAYSASFIDGLVPVVKEGITVFPIQLLLNSADRTLTIYNANEKIISTIPIDDEFLPVEWAKDCFGSATVETADRMQLHVNLILEADINLYIALQELKAAQKPEVPDFPVIMMAYSGPPVTNIKFVAAETTGSCVMLTIAYPNDYTNDLEIFGCTNLLVQDWSLLATTNVNLTTNWIEWVDLDSSNYVMRFYDAWNADADTDSDGISDGQEKRIYGTDKDDWDSDDDMLGDGVEIGFGTDPLSNTDTNSNTISDDWELFYFGGSCDRNADPDDDGLDNEAEYDNATDPNNKDTDSDGLNDYEEVYRFDSDPNIVDTDGDGLDDAEEALLYFTAADDSDTDNDGLSDYAEVIIYGTYARNNDTDEDGLDDAAEITLGTSPFYSDSDGDGIDDAYEENEGWDPLSASNATGDDDFDGYNNVTEYQWCTDPGSSNSAPVYYNYQRLILRAHGSNSIRRIADSTHYKILAVGDQGDYSAMLRIRPVRGPDGEIAAQHLLHSQAQGIYINGTEASSLSSPIVIPAQTTAVEYKITSDLSSAVTNLYLQLADTNDNVGLYCSARFYTPDLPRVDFYGPQLSTYAASAATLWVGVPDDTNACRVYIDPDQTPTSTYGVPNFYKTDDMLLKVEGYGATNLFSLNRWNYLATHGFDYDYREADAETRGLLLAPGTRTLVAGFDMNGDHIIQTTEGIQTCTVHVVEADINGDYNRTGTPSDSTNEASEVSFTNTYGMVILANCDDDDGDGEPDCSDDTIGTNDLADIAVLSIDRFGIASNDLTNITVLVAVLDPETEELSDAAYIYPYRAIGVQGGRSINIAASAPSLFSGEGTCEFGIEGRKFGEEVIVRMTVKHGSTVLDTDEIRVLVSPWLALGNERPVEKIYCGLGYATNFQADMNSHFGSSNIDWSYANPIDWFQDQGEFGYTRTGTGQATYEAKPVVLSMSALSETNFDHLISSDQGWSEEAEEFLRHHGGSVDVAMSAGSNYPFGRLVLTESFVGQAAPDWFKKQAAQWPAVTIPTDWLRVGHVDEMVSLVPNGSSVIAVVGDLQQAIDIVQDYATYPTQAVESSTWTNAYLSRSALSNYYSIATNSWQIEAIQTYLDAAASNIASELGCTVARIPVLYSLDLYEGGEAGQCKSLLPNSVNIAIANFDGTVKLGIPDPRFQPFRAVIDSTLSGISNRAWINTDLPHTYGGDAHCAYNTDKTPPSEP